MSNTIIVKVENETGETITNIKYRHRYDEDVYNDGNLTALSNGALQEIGTATYWTGFLRTGVDYWWIQFEKGGEIYTCKANFYCYLTSEDAESKGAVKLRLKEDSMEVVPPKSSSCSVKLYKSAELLSLITQDHAQSGVAEGPQPEDASKKCCAIE